MVQLSPATDVETGLDHAVLNLLHRLLLDDSNSNPATGCVVHPTGKIKWLGATFNARRVVWQHEHGLLGEDVMVGSTCNTDGCAYGPHLVARTRSEHGRWLGNDGWKARRQSLPGT